MPHKLLLADDSVTIQRVIELTFADEDVEVTTVGDGQLAIERLETDPPDIVLADVDMPKRDGYEVAAYVKSRPKLAHIPVVLLTGAFEPIDQARAATAGSTDVLAKPFEPQMVINRVKELLAKKQPEAAPVESPRPQSSARPQAPPPSQVSSPIPAGRQAEPAGGQPTSLDDYFDQLDAAFSNLQPETAPAADAAAEMDWAASAPIQPVSAMQGAGTASAGKPAAASASKPVSKPVAPPPPAAPAASKPWPAPPLVPPPASAAVAATADKPAPPPRAASNPFATLSAAKAEAAARQPAPVISDELIEEIVSRVLQRLSDEVVRETVTEIVSQTAERLVRDEIDRIKNAGQ